MKLYSFSNKEIAYIVEGQDPLLVCVRCVQG